VKPSRYTIGIDLGTSNCALAFTDTREVSGGSQVTPVSQLESAETVSERTLFPSFLYHPPESEAEQLPEGGLLSVNRTNEKWALGQFARAQAGTRPGRVIHSAKSWLCHGGINREAPILPWKSDEVGPEHHLSPVEASAALLRYLKEAWDARYATDDAARKFANQEVVVTVPASFDEAAQKLTLEAAQLAGYPKRLRLLEEPQAAFYYWLERHAKGTKLLDLLPALRERAQTVLVCDIGGGTSDFSLFRIDPLSDPEKIPSIQRIQVSEHLLLGGDNIDLALAHALEAKLPENHAKLSAAQWAFLVAAARDLKERALKGRRDPSAEFSVAIPGTGSRLLAQTLSASLTAEEIEAVILDGFFPLCSREERPRQIQSGLREMGLPFAADPAVTRHLAAFLDGQKVNGILYTGGSLKPEFLRDRLTALIGDWQDGSEPVELHNPEPDLAVALGAAHYGKVLREPFGKISGGYPHSLYLEIQTKGKDKRPQLVCILPKGFEEGQTARVQNLNLKLLVGKPVRFQPYSSLYRQDDQAGDLAPLDEDLFHPLPALQTGIALQEGLRKPADGRLPVFLESSLNELGLLEISCVHRDDSAREYRWDLSFNLRQKTEDVSGATADDTDIAPEKVAKAAELIGSIFSKGKRDATDLKPRRLGKELEAILGRSRSDWSLPQLRALWPAFNDGMTLKSRSPEHEATWLNLAGFALRPGYGAETDPYRIDEAWRVFSLGLSHPKDPRVLNQWWIFWRRISGGLDSLRHEELLAKYFPQIESRSLEGPEVMRFLGALERVSLGRKEKLVEVLVRFIERPKKSDPNDAASALGRVLNRTPLYAGPDSVLAPQMVEETFDRLEKLDWRKTALSKLNEAFSRAARVSGMRELDLPETSRAAVIAKLEKSGASPEQIRVVNEFVPVEMEDRARLFGESFPAGLILF
jgi:molecular chaperone DnaK (HSP70)